MGLTPTVAVLWFPDAVNLPWEGPRPQKQWPSQSLLKLKLVVCECLGVSKKANALIKKSFKDLYLENLLSMELREVHS